MENRIVYILGAGRSGTTLLDIILGNAGNVFSAGELNRFTKRNGVPHDARDENVSCFWETVVDNLKARNFNEPRWYYKLASKFEYHSSFYRFILPFKNKDFDTYAEYQKALFAAVGENASAKHGRNIIVDSSKYPLRALSLAKIFNGEISFIYLQRNPSIVVESFQNKDVEQPPKNRVAANIYLFVVNTLAMRVLKRLRKTHQVSIITYDNLLSDPVGELAKIEKDIGLDLTVSKKLIEQQMPLKVGYLFDGNRLRLSEDVLLKTATPVVSGIKGINKVFYPLHKFTWYKY